MVRRICGLIVTLALSACSALAGQDTVGTLQAQNQAILDSATAIAQAAQAQQTLVVGTAIGVQTLVVERNSINQQLLATVRVNETPSGPVVTIEPVRFAAVTQTPVPVALAVASPPVGAQSDAALLVTAADAAAMTAAPSTELPTLTPISARGSPMAFVDTVTTNAIRDSDGCAEGSQRQFAQSTRRIYVVTRALNLRAGTTLAANWYYGGKSISLDRWTAPNDTDELCVWFYISSDTEPFSPGEWVVQITADGQAITPMSFTIVGSADGAQSGDVELNR